MTTELFPSVLTCIYILFTASRNKSKERELDGPDYPAPQNGAEMRYGGAHIPGQSFRLLQQSIGDGK